MAQRDIWRLVPASGVPRGAKGDASGGPAMGLQNRNGTALDDRPQFVNPYIRGRINDYSHFDKSALCDSLRRIDSI
jgi:hypothetical protein